MKGNPSAVGNNLKSFGSGASVSFGKDNNPTGQIPTGGVTLNLMEFNRTKGTSAGTSSAPSKEFPKGKSIDRPTEGFSGRGVQNEAKPGVVKIGASIRSNVNG